MGFYVKAVHIYWLSFTKQSNLFKDMTMCASTKKKKQLHFISRVDYSHVFCQNLTAVQIKCMLNTVTKSPGVPLSFVPIKSTKRYGLPVRWLWTAIF